MLTADDLRAAITWRIEGIPVAEIETIAAALRPLAAGFMEDRPEVAAALADLCRPGDRRGTWSLACAVLAADALLRSDAAMFFSAGFEVVGALRQSQRGRHHNRAGPPPDALDALIAAESMPAAKLFDECAKSAWRYSDVIVEYDSTKDELVCQLDPGNQQLTNISRTEFGRRDKRLRRAA